MTSAAAASSAPRNAVLEAARGYTRRGWRLVPIPHGEKAPQRKAWQKLRLGEKELPTYFAGHLNVGVLLGEASGGLIDIDLDHPLAVGAADFFLPRTGLVSGRQSKPRSHFWYVADPIPKPEKFPDPNTENAVVLGEIRANGQQTVVPPSTHPSGEAIRWEQNGEPVKVAASALRSAMGRVMAATLAALHWPAPGSRHDAALALAGLLLRSGWGEADAMRFVEAVAQLAADEEFRSRAADVRTTARRIAAGGPATGKARLTDLLGKRTVARLYEWLSLRPTEHGGGIESLPDLHREIRAVVLDQATPMFDKRRSIVRLIEGELKRCGRFLRTSDGRAFFFHGEERRLFDLEQTAFQHFLTAISGLGATETYFAFALAVLQATASRDAVLTEVHSFAHFDPATGQLAVSDGAGGMWLREPGTPSWVACHNGDHGVLFLTEAEAQAWAPEFNGVGSARAWFLDQFLFTGGRLSVQDGKTLLAVWIAQQFFPPLRRTRLIPAFLGPHGSGKTTAERLLGHLLVGPSFEVSGLQREKEDAFVAAVTNRVMLGIDNADANIPWLPDALALYATGQRYRLRRLYSTNEEVCYTPRAILFISSRDPRFNRPDVTERLLPLYFERPATYRTEDEIFQELAKRRGLILGSFLEHVAQIADILQKYPPVAVPFRMADFGSFGARFFSSLGRLPEWTALLGRLEHAQAEFASEGDGVILALGELLRQEGGVIEMAAGALFSRCAAIAHRDNLLFPKSAQSFGRRLSTMRRVLELELSVVFQESRAHAGERLVRITQRQGEEGVDGGDSRP